MDPRRSNGFALPTILVASIIMLSVLVVTLSSIVSVRVSLKDQYYIQLKQAASESGVAYAKACLVANGNIPQWSDATPLKPNTDCSGAQLAGADCTVAANLTTIPLCSVTSNNSSDNRFISTFEVGLPKLDANGKAIDVTAKGSVDLLRPSDNSPWRSYNSVARLSYAGFIPAPSVLTSGLLLNLDASDLASYPGGGTSWFDPNSSGKIATLVNGPVNNNGSITFDGVDDYALGTSNLGISGNAEFTMCSWIKWTGSSWSADYPSFMGNNSTGVIGQGLSFTVKDGRPAIDFWVNRWRANAALNINTWYYVCGTKMPGIISTTSKIYINGVLVSGAVEGTDASPNVTNSSLILARLDATRYFKGSIGESNVYNRALSGAEIRQNFDAHKTRYQPPSFITNGITLNLDASNPLSYPGSGTTWTNLNGSVNNGALVNGTVYSTNNNGVLNFDGVNDLVDCGNNSSLDSPNQITISAWVKWSSSAVKEIIVKSDNTNTGVGSYEFYQSNNNVVFRTIKGGVQSNLVSATSIQPNTWANIVATWDGTTKNIYINGVQDANTQAQSSPIDITTGKLVIGGYANALYPFAGSIGETKIYNRALKLTEVQQNFNVSKNKYQQIQVLVVGGGGGGSSGGGGAGGLIHSPVTVAAQTYAVTVGAGGAGCPANTGTGCTNGQNSVFGSLTAIGGGYGGKNDNTTSAKLGGSGGGGGSSSTVQDNGGAGTAGQGNSGGTVTSSYFVSPYPSAGGGGAGAAGSNPTGPSVSGNGGNGLPYSISGTLAYYAGGGGGSTWSGGTNGSGGLGGGGNGGLNGAAGIANTGGGGGGGAGASGGSGGAGGSGVVIISYPTGYIRATGGTITTSGGNTIHTFTSNGTFTIGPVVQVLVVAGGGSAAGDSYWGGGGGGAGGLLSGSQYVAGAMPVTVGAGGVPATHTNGGNSIFGTFTAIGGGRGGYGCSNQATTVGASGGSGGGGFGCGGSSVGGVGTASQGYAGGSAVPAAIDGGGGGGGAGGVGANGPGSQYNIAGGIGISSSISGSAVTYATGGMGNGGGAGTANTGNGAGGAGSYSGGSGVVIISYPTGYISATGGTITTSGGNTIHKFTSSGTFTVNSSIPAVPMPVSF